MTQDVINAIKNSGTFAKPSGAVIADALDSKDFTYVGDVAPGRIKEYAEQQRIRQLEAELSTAKADLQKQKEASASNGQQVQELLAEVTSIKKQHATELKSREETIRTLEKQVEQLKQAEITGELVKKVSEKREQQNEELKAEVESLKIQLDAIEKLKKADADALQISCMELQDKNVLLDKELRILKRRVGTSYSAEELANSFNNTINSFNAQMNSADQSVTYIINSMDVDLKAQIVKDENNQVRFLTEMNSEGENAMSTLKITIRAVPK